jgi:putative membrane protein
VAKWKSTEIILFVIGTAVAFALTVLNPLNGSENPLLVFIAGAIAISALILPGISGSFILVLLGMYTVVFPALRGLLSGDLSQLTTFLAFGFGCLAGLAVFSRVLTYTFKTYPNQTLALLTGFMLGSLNKLWPWRNTLTTRIDSSGEIVPVLEENVLPAAYDGNPIVLAVVICLVAGLAIVFILEAVSGDKDPATEKAREEFRA